MRLRVEYKRKSDPSGLLLAKRRKIMDGLAYQA
jgi:hypothetical protein